MKLRNEVRSNMEQRHIRLPGGGTLELEIMPGFYDRVRAHLGLEPGCIVDDDQVRMFVYGSVKNAIDKAEGNIDHDIQTRG